jgi:hypothetical protein
MNLKQFIDDFIMDMLDKPEAVIRLNQCVRCNQFDKETFKCNQCGCFLKAKILIPITSCPQNKW